jgi:hypothetical protein
MDRSSDSMHDAPDTSCVRPLRERGRVCRSEEVVVTESAEVRPGRVPLRERVEWFLSVARERPFTADERDERFVLPELMDASTIDRAGGPWGEFREEAYEELSPTYARVLVRGSDGERWALRAAVESNPPHRFRYVSRWNAPEGVVTRLATDADAGAIADLERRTPIVDGDTRRTYDRSGDWFAQLRLMEEPSVVVAEVDGRIVGVMADGINTAPIDGRTRRLLYRLRLRVDPAVRGKKLWPALNGAAVDRRLPRSETGWGFDSEDMFVAAGNERMLNLTQPGGQPVASHLWRTPVERVLVDCSAVAGPPAGREATAADAEQTAAILGAGRGQEVACPTGTAALARRLDRSPVYGWRDLVLDDDAVLGVWDEQSTIAIESPTGRAVERCALGLDYGALPGREERLRALVAAACARLAAKGTTHLVLFTSPGAPLRDAVLGLAARTERFRRFSRVPEPADAGRRGVYVDPIYF